MDSPLPTLEEYEKVQNEEEALQIENRIRKRLDENLPWKEKEEGVDIIESTVTQYKFILALDVGYSTKSELNVAVGILYDIQSKSLILKETLSQRINQFNYIPGFLAFRELPLLGKVLINLLSKITSNNDLNVNRKDILLLCDGNGTLHPRLCGIACHLGVLFDLPSIGVGKTYLIGNPKDCCNKNDDDDHSNFDHLKALVKGERGNKLQLFVQNKFAGFILRSQTNVKPIFISSGFKTSQENACEIVLTLCSKFRQPEPIRIADHLGRMEIKRLELNK